MAVCAFGLACAPMLNAKEGPEVGDRIGRIVGVTQMGDTVHLPEDLRGKYVLVETSTTDSAYFKSDIQFYIRGAYAHFHESGFEWVSVRGWEENSLLLVNPEGIVCARGSLLRGSGLENYLRLLNPSVPMYETVSVEELDDLLARDPAIQLVDVRTAGEYEAGAIPNARLLDVKSADFIDQAERLLDKSRPVAVYCKGGGRSRIAAWQLIDKGFKVYNLDKGFESWQATSRRR